jgi:hypothetical protein
MQLVGVLAHEVKIRWLPVMPSYGESVSGRGGDAGAVRGLAECWRASSLPVGIFPGLEGLGGGAVEHGAVGVEAGPVAGAVPGAFGVVERDDAAQVGAHRGDRMQLVGVVAVDGATVAVDADDGAGAGGPLRRSRG